MSDYGKELILDLHDCDVTKFNRKAIKRYFTEICQLIEMEPCIVRWWDDVGVLKVERQTEPHLKGTTAIQFIQTSDIRIHTLDILKKVYINIFSCKDFKPMIAKNYSRYFFKGKVVQCRFITRK